jgi:type 1 glutamine amidotransferase
VRAALVAAVFAMCVPAAASGPAGKPGPRPEFRLLTYSQPGSLHHSTGSVQAAAAAIERLGKRHSFRVASRQRPAVFRDEVLRRYDAVAMISPDGDVLDAGQQAAFERFIRAGGGFVGIHAASAAEPDWPFFVDLLGARVVSHPPLQAATVLVEDRDHPATSRLPDPWVRSDEWYEFDRDPRAAVHVLASIDFSAIAGASAGGVRPISWCRRFEGGRSFYTAMGHEPQAYAEPALRRHLLGGIRWAARDARGDCG